MTRESTGGHVTVSAVVALWRDQELFLCESNAKTPYWPVNGVQVSCDWWRAILSCDWWMDSNTEL